MLFSLSKIIQKGPIYLDSKLKSSTDYLNFAKELITILRQTVLYPLAYSIKLIAEQESDENNIDVFAKIYSENLIMNLGRIIEKEISQYNDYNVFITAIKKERKKEDRPEKQEELFPTKEEILSSSGLFLNIVVKAIRKEYKEFASIFEDKETGGFINKELLNNYLKNWEDSFSVSKAPIAAMPILDVQDIEKEDYNESED